MFGFFIYFVFWTKTCLKCQVSYLIRFPRVFSPRSAYHTYYKYFVYIVLPVFRMYVHMLYVYLYIIYHKCLGKVIFMVLQFLRLTILLILDLSYFLGRLKRVKIIIHIRTQV